MADPSVQSRLDSVSNSQENIQSLSLWLLHHKKHHKNIVDQWKRAIVRAKPSHRLTLLYLANDVIQNARKKGIKEYLESFRGVLPHVMNMLFDNSISKNVVRVLDIWTQRNIYPKDFIDSLKMNVPSQVDTKVPESAMTTQIVAEFKLKQLVDKVKMIEEIEKESNIKCDSLTNVRLNVVTSEILNHLKDKTLGDHLLKEADEARNALTIAIDGLEKEVTFKRELIESLTKALVYYVVKEEEVDHEFKAYVKIGQNVACVMQELNKASMVPPTDAPSPSNSDDGVKMSNIESIPQTTSLDQRLETILHGIIQDGRRHASSVNLKASDASQSYESHLMNQPYDPASFSGSSPHDSSFVRPIPAVVSARDSNHGHHNHLMSSHYDSFAPPPPVESCEPSDMDTTNSDDEEYSPSNRLPISSSLRVIDPHQFQVRRSNYPMQADHIDHHHHHQQQQQQFQPQQQQQASQYAQHGQRDNRNSWNTRAANVRSPRTSSSTAASAANAPHNWRSHKGRHGPSRPQPARGDFRHH